MCPLQTRPEHFHVLYTSVMHGFGSHIHFAARLAASGALERIVSDLTGVQSVLLGLEQVLCVGRVSTQFAGFKLWHLPHNASLVHSILLRRMQWMW